MSRWSKKEVEFIKNNYKEMETKELAEHIDQTPRAIRNKLNRLGIYLRDLKRGMKYNWSEEDIEFLKSNYKDMIDQEIADKLGKSKAIVCNKRLELGLKKNGLRKINGDIFMNGDYQQQYVNGERIWVHVKNAEEKIGRKLKKEEYVHHIDGNKTNNEPSNLYISSNNADHQKLHHQLERIAFDLVKKGVIGFDHKNGKYYIKTTRTEGDM